MTGKEFIREAIDYGFEKAQVTEKKCSFESFVTLNEEIQSKEFSDTTKYRIQVEKNEKSAVLNVEYLDPLFLSELEEQLEYLEGDRKANYVSHKKQIEEEERKEESIFSYVEDALALNYLRQKQFPLVTKLEACMELEKVETKIYSSEEAELSKVAEFVSFYIESYASRGEDTTTSESSVVMASLENFSMETIAKQVMKDSVSLLEKESISTGSYDILLTNQVVSRIIGKIIPMFSGSEVARKTSFFTDQLGKRIFSSKINLVEDPQNRSFPGKNIFDDEGLLTTKKFLIRDGVLEMFLYDTKTAFEEQKEATGNFYNGISVRNLYLQEGQTNFTDLLGQMQSGLLITDFMGSSVDSINTATGQISLQVFGFIIKNGKIISGFAPCILTTNIIEFFGKVEEVGNDLQFTSTATGSPSILVKNLNIAGE